jgi:hypothetical protein
MSPGPTANPTVFDSQTAIYSQGVGLGASKGRELGKYTEGYSGYVNMVQDAVSDVERGDKMGNLGNTEMFSGPGTLWKLNLSALSFIRCSCIYGSTSSMLIATRSVFLKHQETSFYSSAMTISTVHAVRYQMV